MSAMDLLLAEMGAAQSQRRPTAPAKKKQKTKKTPETTSLAEAVRDLAACLKTARLAIMDTDANKASASARTATAAAEVGN